MVRLLTKVRTGPLWRQLLSCALAYALVLQGILFALGGAQLAAAASAEAAPSIEICLHDPADAAGLPDSHADSKAHCPFCLTAAHQAIATPCGCSAPIIRSPSATMLWPASVGTATSTRFLSHPPRGPPLGA
jgi:hypothetical protein